MSVIFSLSLLSSLQLFSLWSVSSFLLYSLCFYLRFYFSCCLIGKRYRFNLEAKTNRVSLSDQYYSQPLPTPEQEKEIWVSTWKSDQSHGKGKALVLWSPTWSGLRKEAVITSGSSAEQIQGFHWAWRVARSLYCWCACFERNVIKTGL